MSEFTLVALLSKADYVRESETQQHAISFYYDHFLSKGIRVYSLRRHGVPLLTFSVQSDNSTSHIVGLRNRQPTADEFQVLAPFLLKLGIENKYDPGSLA